MGKVISFKLVGVQLWFWSFDHAPPHFHAKKSGEWEYRVWFLEDSARMLEPVWERSPISSRYRKTIVENAQALRMELLEEWEEKVQAQ